MAENYEKLKEGIKVDAVKGEVTSVQTYER
jgi:hypothetical protein